MQKYKVVVKVNDKIETVFTKGRSQMEAEQEAIAEIKSTLGLPSIRIIKTTLLDE